LTEQLLDFSLRFYVLPGVQEACLALQDRDAADVNMVLFALWAASNGRPLTEAELEAADRAALYWRDAVVRPLRAVRRGLSAPPADADGAQTQALREAVKAAELKAEFLQQNAMEKSLAGPGDQAASAALAHRNLALYAAFKGGPFGQAEMERLICCFDEEAI
jgi:uncharacterized protein (TIGR02444 family)